MKENNQTTADMSGLVDIRDVKVDRSLPVEDRIRSYVEQVKDPYCFRVGDVKVRVCRCTGKLPQRRKQQYPESALYASLLYSQPSGSERQTRYGICG